jgi:ABC-type multidrug transport system ATPase subunit
MVQAVLHVEGLRFSYPQRALFSDWRAQIAPGVTFVRGDESTGKSTLLRLLAGALPAQAGQLQINGITLSQQPTAYAGQVFWAEPRSEVHDAITPLAYFETVRQRYPRFDSAMMHALIDGLSLTEHQHKPLYMLSPGSKRKVWLTAAFACGATVTLLDDPFAALDKVSIRHVIALLQQQALQATRVWVVAGYEVPDSVPLTGLIEL